MPNKNYERGRASEYKAQRDLEALGYQTTRTAGSHGAADVIAWNGEHTRYIQCKTTTGKVSLSPRSYPEDRQKIYSMLLGPHSQAEMWVRKIGQKGWAVQEVLRKQGCTEASSRGCTSSEESTTTRGVIDALTDTPLSSR